MPLRPHHVVIDAHDLLGLATFWCAVLGWRVLSEREREVVIGPSVDAPIGNCFMPSADEKTVKNRVHLDLATGADDRDVEIERALSLGASRVDIGQTRGGVLGGAGRPRGERVLHRPTQAHAH